MGRLRPRESGRNENAGGSALVLALISAIGWRRYLELRWPRERYVTEPIPDHLVADLGIAPLVTKNLDAIAGMGVVQKRNGGHARGRERLRRVRRGLSPSERRYLRLASYGHGVSESAALVGRSRTQVTRALASARLVLGAETVPQAVAIAVSDRKIDVKPLRKRRIILREHEMKILQGACLGPNLRPDRAGALLCARQPPGGDGPRDPPQRRAQPHASHRTLNSRWSTEPDQQYVKLPGLRTVSTPPAPAPRSAGSPRARESVLGLAARAWPSSPRPLRSAAASGNRQRDIARASAAPPARTRRPALA